MSVDPFNRSERKARVEDAAREELTHAAISHSTYAYAVRRWDATVQAAEAEREDWMRRGLAAVERAEAAEERLDDLRAAMCLAMADLAQHEDIRGAILRLSDALADAAALGEG